jgi:hypothetical protein
MPDHGDQFNMGWPDAYDVTKALAVLNRLDAEDAQRRG